MANTKITPHVLDSTLISGHSTVTAATNDFVLIQDVSDSGALKKALVSDLAQNEESPTFTGAVTSAGLVVDTDTLVVDSTNDRVGIGISSPDEMLHLFDGGTDTKIKVQSKVAADATASILLMSRLADNSNKNVTLQAYRGNLSVTGDSGYGKVGIGNTTPAKFLDVGISSDAAATDANIRLSTHYGTNNVARGGIQWYDGSDETGQIDTRYDGTTVDMHFGSLYNSGYNTTSRMVITGNGNVGIGETTPLASLHIKQGDSGLSSLNAAAHHLFLEDTGSNGPGITFASGTSSNCTLAFGDSDSNYQGFLLYDNSADAMKFGVAGTGEKLRIQSGGGISFNGDAAAANALDDYEEGTWTPTLSSGSISVSAANYVKIGRFVHANTYFTFSSLTNDGNVFRVNGLPYNCTSGNHYGGGVISYSHAANTADLQPLVASGNNYIYFHETDGVSAVVSQANIVGRFANGAGYILMNMSYMTA